ncbi:MAG: PA domain-containing protein, partial [Gemmataceae bacterium]
MQKSSHLQRKGWKLLAWMALLGLVNPGQAETKEELNRAAEARLKKDILFLASPECEGRGPTTDGLRKAGDYLADEFAKIGLKPGFKGSYFQPFTIAGAQGKIQLTRPQGPPLELKAKQDFLPLGTDQEGKAEGSLVFAGYGLTCKEPAYDDYADIDVKGKIVVLLRDTPRSTDKDRPREMVAGSSFTAKMTLAQKKGALAVLFLNDADSAKDGDPLMDYTYTSVTRGGKHLPAFVLKRAVFEQLLPPGKALPELETKIDKELKPQSFDIPNCKASVEALKKADGIALRNVVGIHEGSGNL